MSKNFRMDTQDENKQQEFDQEVDTVVRKSKRKLSEGQLKALAEGRRKRWEKKRSKTSDVSVLAEETPSDVDSELITEEKKVNPTVQKATPAAQKVKGVIAQRVLIYILLLVFLAVIVQVILILMMILE